MPRQVVETIDGSVAYWLACFDEEGVERTEGGGRFLSRELLEDVRRREVSDVFFVSHGWKGDVPAAIRQYDAWIAATAACPDDLARARATRRGFEPMIVGLHWPSLPWGDENLPGDESVGDPGVDGWSGRIAGTPAAREALSTILARDAASPDAPLDAAAVAAFRTLDREADLADERMTGESDEDAAFDPAAAAAEAEPVDEEGDLPRRRGIRGLLRQFSYWKMKQRARSFGEGGAHALLKEVQAARPGVRCHVMGHSFGCIVASGMINGPQGSAGTTVHSAMLVQGALSLWAYSSRIPLAPSKKGCFSELLEKRKVSGPIVTTQSRFDSAVGKAYPRATRLRGGIEFDADDAAETFPKYGAIGAFGIQGIEGRRPGVLLPLDRAYDMRPGMVHNLDGDAYINSGDGASGAHSDIAHPEVAHAMWAAVLTDR